ncbi:hypothetical protein GQ457_01G019810 [Hibiscus cannabinus]
MEKSKQHPQSPTTNSAWIPEPAKAESTTTAKSGISTAHRVQKPGESLNQFMAQTSAYMARTDRFIQKTYAFMDRREMKLQNHDATLKYLETQVGQISQILSNGTGVMSF